MVYGICSADLAQDPGGPGGGYTAGWPHLAAWSSVYSYMILKTN